ncbi:MAG: YcjF family protein [Hyphomicrobiaceae bacterium]
MSRRLSDLMLGAWKTVVSPPADPAIDEAISQRAAATAPVVWLIGKVQSGKSSIVKALTGATSAEIGDGLKACTRTATVFDFPADAPVIRFLDTRGLGEASYDAAADIAFAESQAHLLLVVMRATDPAQDAVLAAVRQARRRHPDWPVLVAQTSLHEAYVPGSGHIAPYPFQADGTSPTPLPGDLARLLAHQRSLFAGLPGTGPVRFVPLDFTQADDGYEPRLYGLEVLREAIASIAPAAVIAAINAPAVAATDARAARAHPHVMGYAAAAAAADVFPIAGAVAVPGVQAKMLHSLGTIYGITWDRRLIGEFAGALGTGALARMAGAFGARQLGKLIPVYGQTAGAAAAAAMSFATTYALGKAAVYYLGRKRVGETGTEGVAEAYKEALQQAFTLAKERGETATSAAPPPDKADGR